MQCLGEDEMLDRCQKLRLLGQGGFGTVHEVLCEDGQVSSYRCSPCSLAYLCLLPDVRPEDRSARSVKAAEKYGGTRRASSQSYTGKQLADIVSNLAIIHSF